MKQIIKDKTFSRDGKAGQSAPHWPVSRLACKNAGRVGPPRRVIAGLEFPTAPHKSWARRFAGQPAFFFF